jgi:hypothetical protein
VKDGVAVIGTTVVLTGNVVTAVDPIGQLVTVGGQLRIVYVLVLKIVSVV